jgi:hypothetical protein
MALLVWESPHDEDGGGKRTALLLFSECLYYNIDRGKKKSDADPAEAEIRHVDFRTGLLCEGGGAKGWDASVIVTPRSCNKLLLVEVLKVSIIVHHGRDYSDQPSGAAVLRPMTNASVFVRQDTVQLLRRQLLSVVVPGKLFCLDYAGVNPVRGVGRKSSRIVFHDEASASSRVWGFIHYVLRIRKLELALDSVEMNLNILLPERKAQIHPQSRNVPVTFHFERIYVRSDSLVGFRIDSILVQGRFVLSY